MGFFNKSHRLRKGIYAITVDGGGSWTLRNDDVDTPTLIRMGTDDLPLLMQYATLFDQEVLKVDDGRAGRVRYYLFDEGEDGKVHDGRWKEFTLDPTVGPRGAVVLTNEGDYELT